MKLNHQPIRVLVVDDSTFMRNRLSMMLMKYDDIKVVGTAKSGQDAIKQVQRIQPDVMTLDIEMPGMNGLQVLEHMMVHAPLPIIMVSAHTEEGASVTLQALERGAVDFIPKPTASDVKVIEQLLLSKIRAAHEMRHRLLREKPLGLQRDATKLPDSSSLMSKKFSSSSSTVVRGNRGDDEGEPTMSTHFPLVIIGASTGGPSLLKTLIQDLPESLPGAVLIIQHMPKFFTKVFAENLNRVSAIPIREAQDGDVLQSGQGLVAPGDHHIFITRQANGQATISLSTEMLPYPYRPSIDGAMVSAAEQFGRSIIGFVLTGMGNDGMAGSQAIKERGGKVIAQDEATSLIYGMPRAVVEANLADAVLPDIQLGGALIQAVDSLCLKRGNSDFPMKSVQSYEVEHA